MRRTEASHNLLAFALAVDALITPTVPQPVRRDYMIVMLGQRFIGREVYSRTVMRYQSRREKTGTVRYGPNGPQELMRMMEEACPSRSTPDFVAQTCATSGDSSGR